MGLIIIWIVDEQLLECLQLQISHFALHVVVNATVITCIAVVDGTAARR